MTDGPQGVGASVDTDQALASGQAATRLDASRCDPSREAAAALAELSRRFGPGFSSGVAAILLHDSLPDQFNKAAWEKWFFKPADAAFDVAFDMGLIAPWKLSSKWVLTPLGRECASILQDQLRDADGSPKGTDAQRLDGEAATAGAGTASPEREGDTP